MATKNPNTKAILKENPLTAKNAITAKTKKTAQLNVSHEEETVDHFIHSRIAHGHQIPVSPSMIHLF
jgi:hypothetical protein